jgi:NDP-sugar pyrophosphorylase family protein
MTQQPTLVILAAGMASRYGSMKQVEGFGPHGETIMDYSIYDAIKAGFGKVVFIIREEFADAFKAIMEPKLSGKIETAYAYQALTSYLPEGFDVPAERSKPWGTAHAVLCSRDVVTENFVVINADDFYGFDGFSKAFAFCQEGCTDTTWGIIGYTLRKTLSEHGTVSRGVCATDENNNLVAINERTEIGWKEGKVVYRDEEGEHEVSAESPVSMNFWCFSPAVFEYSEKLFHQFLKENGEKPKAEFFIPIVGDNFIKEPGCAIRVVPTGAQWFGVTYKQDAPIVKESIHQLVAAGEYPENLWG